MASEFFCTLKGKPAGPFSADELKGLVVVGKLSPSDFLRKGKEGKWVSASKFKKLFEEKQSAPLPPDRQPPTVPDRDRTKDPFKPILAGVIVVFLVGLIGFLLFGHGHKSGTQTHQRRAIPDPEIREKGARAEENGKPPGTKPALANTNSTRKETIVQKKAGKGPGKSDDELLLPPKNRGRDSR
jgi:hypothetical protein